MTSSSLCPKCGTIGRSGKMSCCGRGGSWFGNCGSTGNTKFEHAWLDGLQACRARTQLKIASGHQSNAAQEYDSSNGLGGDNSSALVIVAKIFDLTPNNASAVVDHPIITPVNNVSTATLSSKSANSGADMANSHAITMTATTLVHMPMQNTSITTSAAAHTNILTPQTPTTITVVTTTATMSTQKEAVITDWVSNGI